MRKLLVISIMTALSLTSCLKGYNDYYDESSSERINKAVEQAAQVLKSAQNGWRMEIYPNATQDYGGYTVFAKFDGSQVTAMGELFGTDVTSTSYYSVSAENGPMLSFDTYNDVIHFFADPAVGAQGGMGEAQFGLHGDSDFIVMEAAADFIKLKGRKTGSYAYMYPMQTADWEAEMDEYLDIADRIDALNFNSCKVNGEERDFFFEHTYRDFSSRWFEIEGDNGESIAAPYIYTKNGIKFYVPIEVGKKTISEMTLIDDWYLSSEDGTMVIASPEPIRSNNTFSIAVSGITYMAATATVTPSNNDGYYFDLYPKAAIEGVKNSVIINSLMNSLNSYIPTYTAEFVYSALASEGVDSYEFTGLSPETDYVVVAVGCSVSNEGDRIVATTGLTKYEFRTADMPELEPNYAKWLGTWSAAGVDSYVNHRAQTITGITIDVKIPNQSYNVTGFSILALRTSYPVQANYVASTGTIAFPNQQAVGKSGEYDITYIGHILNGTAQSILTGTYTGMTGTTNGTTGTITGYKTTSWTVNGMDFFALNLSSGSFARFTAAADGFTANDYIIGPFTITKTAAYAGTKPQTEPQTRADVKTLGRGEKLQQFHNKLVTKALNDIIAAEEAPVVYWSSYEAF